jgi:hypothetical protein
MDSSGTELRSDLTTITELLVTEMAPQELTDFNELMQEYFDRYAATLAPRTDSHEHGGPLAFETDGVIIVPLTIAIAAAVDLVIRTVQTELAKEGVKVLLTAVRERWQQKKEPTDSSPSAPHLSPEQLKFIRAEVVRILARFGTGKRRAELIADALVGRLTI